MSYFAVEAGQVNQSNNRFQIANAQQQQLISYDAAGNMTADAYFSYASYEYDANSRAKSVTPSYGVPVKATYDALGQRVQTESTDTSGTYTTRYVYDLSGQIVAEYEQGQLKRERIYRSGSLLATVEQTQQGEQVSYVMSDHQGSTRVVTNQSGQVTGRYDYTPFGNEIAANVGLREASQGYSQPSSVKQGYALTESDTNGLKHTWFRKLDSKQGRFTSPDPYAGSMSIANPQSFNRYAYVGNDPVNFVDPSGLNMEPVQVCGTYRWAEFTPDGQFVQWRGNAFEQCHTEWMWIPNSGGGGGGGGGDPIPIRNLETGLQGVLSNRTCADFVAALISKVAERTGNPAVSTNALELFNRISSQGGYRQVDLTVGGTVRGRITNPDDPATAYIGNQYQITGQLTPEAYERVNDGYIHIALHETIHLAGQNAWYSDRQLAQAAQELTKVPGLPPNSETDQGKWSNYWNDILKSHCPPR